MLFTPFFWFFYNFILFFLFYNFIFFFLVFHLFPVIPGIPTGSNRTLVLFPIVIPGRRFHCLGNIPNLWCQGNEGDLVSNFLNRFHLLGSGSHLCPTTSNLGCFSYGLGRGKCRSVSKHFGNSLLLHKGLLLHLRLCPRTRCALPWLRRPCLRKLILFIRGGIRQLELWRDRPSQQCPHPSVLLLQELKLDRAPGFIGLALTPISPKDALLGAMMAFLVIAFLPLGALLLLLGVILKRIQNLLTSLLIACLHDFLVRTRDFDSQELSLVSSLRVLTLIDPDACHLGVIFPEFCLRPRRTIPLGALPENPILFLGNHIGTTVHEVLSARGLASVLSVRIVKFEVFVLFLCCSAVLL